MQVGPQPAFGLCQGHPLAHGVVFHLILLDLDLPDMHGMEVLRQIRMSRVDTPILILTTESSDQMKQAGRAAGATGWLVKPFDPQKLIEVVRKVIG